jgi:peptidoglycan/xylan/chitin deacetylase (PgdA/CDA1 family)
MRRLTLSFDNGPSPAVTPRVLDELGARDIRTTFFVCGKDADRDEQRTLLTRARREGHVVGNHTFSHTVEFGATTDPEAPAREIGTAQTALGTLAEPERWFRPYGGGGVLGPRLLSPAAVRYLCDGGYSCMLWNSVPRDWEDVDGWPERALRDVEAQPWTVVVLHDVPTGAMAQLARFLDALRDRDVAIVQDFPDVCVPIRAGAVVGPVAHLMP